MLKATHSTTQITSWVTAPDGSLVEPDLKFTAADDGTYTIEFNSESIGFFLAPDKATKRITTIAKIVNDKRYTIIFCLSNYCVAYHPFIIRSTVVAP